VCVFVLESYNYIRGDSVKTFKQKIDVYFDLDGNVEGQLIYYGTVGVMLFIMFFGTLANLFQK
jgi:hypothetical protein